MKAAALRALRGGRSATSIGSAHGELCDTVCSASCGLAFGGRISSGLVTVTRFVRKDPLVGADISASKQAAADCRTV
jgi:hypothetical protein